MARADDAALGVVTETAVFERLIASFYAQNVRLSYWRGTRDHEVDLVAEAAGERIPAPLPCYWRGATGSPTDLATAPKAG